MADKPKEQPKPWQSRPGQPQPPKK